MNITVNTKINDKQRNTTALTKLTIDKTLAQQTKSIEKWINNNPIFGGVDLRGAVIDDTTINQRDNTINRFTLRLHSTQGYPRINFILPQAAIALLRGYKFRCVPWADTTDKLQFAFFLTTTNNEQTYFHRITTGGNMGCGADNIRVDYHKSSYDSKIYVNYVFNGGKSNIFIRDSKVLFSNILDSMGKREIKLFYPAGNKYLLFAQTSLLHQPQKSNPHNTPAFLEYAKSGKITHGIFSEYYGVLKEYSYQVIDGKLCRDKLLRTLTNSNAYANPNKLINALDDGYSVRQFKKYDTEPFDKQKNWIVESKTLPTKTANKPITKWTINDLIVSGVKNVDLRADILAQIKNQKPASMGKIIGHNPAQGWLIKPDKPLNADNNKPMLIVLLICPTKQNRYLHFVPERVYTGQHIDNKPEYFEINTVEKARRLLMFNNADSNTFYKVINAGLMDTVPALIES